MKTRYCRSCGDPIFWVKQKSGKVMPANRDGKSHFATCPYADANRRVRR